MPHRIMVLKQFPLPIIGSKSNVERSNHDLFSLWIWTAKFKFDVLAGRCLQLYIKLGFVALLLVNAQTCNQSGVPRGVSSHRGVCKKLTQVILLLRNG